MGLFYDWTTGFFDKDLWVTEEEWRDAYQASQEATAEAAKTANWASPHNPNEDEWLEYAPDGPLRDMVERQRAEEENNDPTAPVDDGSSGWFDAFNGRMWR